MRSLILLALVGLAASAAVSNENEPKMVCYFGSWAVYRPGAGKFDISYIDPHICTHLIYTFVGLDGSNVKVLDSWQDLPNDWGKDGFGRFNALREKNPQLKTLVAIGGWNEGSKKYSAMASDPDARKRFAQNAVAFVKKHNFDGFDLDWEYPNQRGGVESDIQNFVELVKEMRALFDENNLILSAAVGAAKVSASKSYNIAEISKYLHFINLMTYDLHGSWEPQTGINAPLYPAASESGDALELNVKASVDYWINNGADRKKLIMGVASYGRSFTLDNPNEAGVGAPVRGAGAAGPYTREPGMLGYNEICEFQSKQDWTVEFHEEHRVPFAYRDNQWVGYENIQSIKEKAEFIKKMGLGGAMIWSIETDDFRGKCGEEYGLIKTINSVLRGGKPPSTTPKPTPKPTTQKPNHEPNQTPKPNQPDNGGSGDGVCTKIGDIADPTTCTKFITCVDAGEGKFEKVSMACAPGTCYKPESGICDWV